MGSLLWIVLIGYGVVMFLVSPTARRFGEFFASRGRSGGEIGSGLLISSVVISWIFAKSITNASNLGAKYGLVGAVGYAGWYLSIPVAGCVIYALRRRFDVPSLSGFLIHKYGRAAAMGFMLVILMRLVNEVWSNTAVVGAYFGASGTTSYFAAALLFALLTLFYSLRGGLRSSVITDAIQLGLGVFLLVFVLALIVPRSGAVPLLSAGEWTLRGGVDLLIVAILQSFSYPFHDPVLTDRAFITRPQVMLRSYLWAGLIAGMFIVVFGLVGVYAKVGGIDVGQDSPLRVAQGFGMGMLSMMTVLMMVSAGSTLDSTLSSFSRAVVIDMGGHNEDQTRTPALLQNVAARLSAANSLSVGRVAMVLAVIIGSLPLFAGAAILKATTVSGTMVIGLAPAFLLFFWKRASSFAFHMGFWPGIAVGVLYAVGVVPEPWKLGDGPYASLLGANVWGSLAAFGGFSLGAWLDGVTQRRAVAFAAAGTTLLLLLMLPALVRAQSATEASARDDESLKFGGQTMFRLTVKRNALDRPSSELYNLRLTASKRVQPLHYFAEMRFRQTPLRSYSPSNIWLQQAWIAWTPPVAGLTVSAGLIYNQLGLFWDGSWFGNLPYLNGHKLDPDMNLEVKLHRPPEASAFGFTAWLQLSPQEDGLNGSFVTARKQERLLLPADLEASTDFREGPAVRARLTPLVRAGALLLTAGVSVQHSVYDRKEPADSGTQTLLGVETDVRLGSHHVFAEYLNERVRDFTALDLERDYWLVGSEFTLFERKRRFFTLLRAGASFQYTDHRPEAFHETFVTARLFTRVHASAGLTLEYVRWQLENEDETELDRFEFIVHAYY